LHAFEHLDISRSLRLQPPRMPRNPRQLPQGHLEKIQDLAGRGMPQPLDILMHHAAKAEAIGDIVDGTNEPRKAVDEGAVEIEDDEGVGHLGGALTDPVRSAIYRGER